MSRKSIGYAIALSLSLGGGAQAADLRFLSSWDKTNPAVPAMAEPFMKGVEAGTKGSIKFNISGPETVPAFEQLQPVSTGVFQMLFTHAVYHYGTTGIAMGLDAVGGTPEQRHSLRHVRGDRQGLPEARPQAHRRRELGDARLPHRAARAGEPGRRPGGAQDSRHAIVHHRGQHARRLAGRAAARRGLFRAREGRGRRRGLAGRRRARHALVRGRQIHAAAGLRTTAPTCS